MLWMLVTVNKLKHTAYRVTRLVNNIFQNITYASVSNEIRPELVTRAFGNIL